MSDARRENLFAKLAAQQTKPLQGDTAPEQPTPSPAPVKAASSKVGSSRKKSEPAQGKRGNPDYCQANAYVPKKLRRAVDKMLIDMEDLDYSTLVEDLLRKWLRSRGVSE